MRENFTTAALALVLCATWTAPAFAEEASLSETEVRELLDEVRELRGTVRTLTNRVQELESDRDLGRTRDAELAQVIASLQDSVDAGTLAGDGGFVRIGTPGFRLSGFAEVIYSYNPRSGSRTLDANRFRAGDADANTFSLQAVQLVLEREATEAGTWGLRVQGEYGKLGEIIDADPNFDSGDNAFSLSEYFATWRTDGLFGATDDWQIGRFQSPLGYESNENTKNVMVTRNPIYWLGTPTTHTGVRAAIEVAPDLTATVYFVNGWDNQLDADSGKTGILSLTTRPVADWYGSGFALNGSWGHEGSEDGHIGDKTGFLEFIWTTQPVESWRTGLDLIMASSSDAIPRPGRGNQARKWHGAAAYLTHDLREDIEMSGRLGYYSDNQFRVGRQRLMDASIAIRYRLAEGLTLMLEIRHDWSPDGQPYRKESGSKTDVQDTITGSVLVEF